MSTTDEPLPSEADVAPANDVPEPIAKKPAKYADAEEAEGGESGEQNGMSGDSGASSTLMKLLGRHPFWDLYIATRNDGTNLPARAKASFVFDMSFRVIIELVVIAIATLVAYKAIFPLPHWLVSNGGGTASKGTP